MQALLAELNIPKPADLAAYLLAFIYLISEAHKWWKKPKDKDTAKEKYGDPSLLRQITRLDEDIHELLSELRQHVNSCRVIVYQFHNGEQFFSGGPIQRMTCVYESVKGGSSRIMEDQKGINTSIMSGFLDKMFEDTPTINKREDLKDTSCRTMLDDLSVTEYACVALKQGPRKVIGAIIVHWFVGIVDKETDTEAIKKAYEKWFEGEVGNTVLKIQRKLDQRLALSGSHV